MKINTKLLHPGVFVRNHELTDSEYHVFCAALIDKGAHPGEYSAHRRNWVDQPYVGWAGSGNIVYVPSSEAFSVFHCQKHAIDGSGATVLDKEDVFIYGSDSVEDPDDALLTVRRETIINHAKILGTMILGAVEENENRLKNGGKIGPRDRAVIYSTGRQTGKTSSLPSVGEFIKRTSGVYWFIVVPHDKQKADFPREYQDKVISMGEIRGRRQADLHSGPTAVIFDACSRNALDEITPILPESHIPVFVGPPGLM